MPSAEPLKVLLVEDDEDDYILARELFAEFRGERLQLDWRKNFATGLEAMTGNQHDVCLVDYRLGAQNGIELLRAALEGGCQAPIILLTGQGEHEIDLEAMKAGAADYLVKGRLDSGSLERSMRYALERKRAADRAASEQARLAAFGAEVGLALTRRDALDAILHRCATAMVHYLHAGLARLWIYEPEEKDLKLHASAGTMEEAGPLAYQQPKLDLDLALIAQGKPILINTVIGDQRLPDQAWAKREGIVAYAGYPLMLEDRLVGLMSVFAKNQLSQAIIPEMASVAHGVALYIEQKRSAEALDASEIK
ncbi:MAG TPA: response regulator, partial [Candidatus Binatia bacterium]|nr:response regulator [Candidatus Binatia bacterium]